MEPFKQKMSDVTQNRTFVKMAGDISTTQIKAYWYVRGKHFDFWQATTEQGKPGYFTTVRHPVCSILTVFPFARRETRMETRSEWKKRGAILDGKPLL